MMDIYLNIKLNISFSFKEWEKWGGFQVYGYKGPYAAVSSSLFYSNQL